jgi:uncharacterized membrane protein YeiH
MDLFIIVSIIGSIAFALSGYLIGARKDLDIMGLFILAMLTANGGGAVRDVLLGRTPSVLTDISAFYLVCVVLLVAILLKLHKSKAIDKNFWFIASDSIGLVAFAITGALMGIDAELSIFGVMVLAFVTATGGGILRDVLVNETPIVLKGDFYGSVALLTAACLYGLNGIGQNNDITTAIVFIIALATRLTAYRLGWHLPKLR